MSAYLEAIRPVLFESTDAQFPYFGKGSSLVLSSVNYFYWVTAKHVIENQQGDVDTLRIFPAESSRSSIPFNRLVKLNTQSSDSDFTDLFILRVDATEFANTGDAPMSGQRVEDGLLDMTALREADEIVVIGFPGEHRAVDYEDFKIRYTRSTYRARYVGLDSQHCGRIEFDANHGLGTFDGLSGSPVYRFVRFGQFICPKVVGILIRGTASSRTAYIINSSVLRHAIIESERIDGAV